MSLVLATTGTDLVLAFWAAVLLAAFFWGYNRWVSASRWYAEDAKRPAPVEPNRFSEAILQHVALKWRRQDEVVPLNADVAREHLERVA